MTCHKCGRKGHIQKECRSKVNGSGGIPPKNSTHELPEWVTKKTVVLDTKYLTMDTMNRNKYKFMWCTSCNNGHSAWVFQWKYGHKDF